MIKVGSQFHLENMANFSKMVSAREALKPTPSIDPKKRFTPEELIKFSDWTGTGTEDSAANSNAAGRDLLKRGLIGADQIVNSPQDFDDPRGIHKNVSNVHGFGDWKILATREILQNARRLNLRTPEEIKANMDVLLTTPALKEGVNHPAFKQLHPNFLQVIVEDILPKQYAKYDAEEAAQLSKSQNKK